MKSAIMFRVAILALCVLASAGCYDNDRDENGLNSHDVLGLFAEDDSPKLAKQKPNIDANISAINVTKFLEQTHCNGSTNSNFAACFMQIMSIMNELKNNNETAAVRQEQLKAIQADLSKVAGTAQDKAKFQHLASIISSAIGVTTGSAASLKSNLAKQNTTKATTKVQSAKASNLVKTNATSSKQDSQKTGEAAAQLIKSSKADEADEADGDEADDGTGGASVNSLTNSIASIVNQKLKMLEDTLDSTFTEYKAFQEKCSQGDDQACTEAQLALLRLQSLMGKFSTTVDFSSNLLKKLSDVNRNIISNIRDTEPQEENTRM
ncbi:uncharacterized protein LOC143452743 isoform X2 [Clavelina lepadiformis]|uniref:uncharacterized protein LOC143452743 isoform X2 n=1 Tax=Clavelina lepadiformis TaxID=159417 RepID=UPI0040432E73